MATVDIKPNADGEGNLGQAAYRWISGFFSSVLSDGTNEVTVAQMKTASDHVSETDNPHGTDIGNIGSGTLAELNAAISDATLDTSSATRTPSAHAANHITGGSDAVDGDKVDIGYIPSHYTRTTTPTQVDNVANLTAHLGGIDDKLVDFVSLTGNETVAGIKTFSSFPVTPSSEPTSDYQVANKKMVDDLTASDVGAVATTGNETIAGVKTFSSFPVTPGTAPTTNYQAANKKYVDDSFSSLTWDGDIDDIDIIGGDDIGVALVDTDLMVVDREASGSNFKFALSRIWTYITTKIQALTAKETPVDADILMVQDSAASNALKELTIGNLWDNRLLSDAQAIQLDDFAATSDNTDLDATTSAHGLLPKLGGGTTNFLRADGTWAETPGGVTGASSSTDNAIARFDSTTGKIIQNSTVTIDDDGNIIPAADNSQTLGDATHSFENAYFTDENGVEITLRELAYLHRSSTNGASFYPFTVSHSVVGSVWTVTITDDSGHDEIAVSLDSKTLIHSGATLSVNATSFAGTDASPKIVYIYIQNDGADAPELIASNTNPDGVVDRVDVATWVVGAVAASSVNIYGGTTDSIQVDSIADKVYHRFWDQGSIYRSGFGVTATSTDVTFAAGQMETIVTPYEIDSLQVSVDGMFSIASDGTYITQTDFAFTEYSTGETIGANKFYNVVLGVVHSGTDRVVALVQKGMEEYTSIDTAIADAHNLTVTQPSNTVIKNVFIPICRVIIKNDASDNLQQIPSGSGVYYIDLRGTVASSGGGGSVAGSGDVVGGASSTDNAIARYDGITGKLIQNSGVTVDDSNNIDTAGSVATDTIFEHTADNGVSVDGLTIKDSGLAIGSDADGDIYYRSSGALARLAKGTAAQVLTMNSGATAPEWAASGGGGGGGFAPTETTALTDADKNFATTDLNKRWIYLYSTMTQTRTSTIPSLGSSDDGKFIWLQNDSKYFQTITLSDSDTFAMWPSMSVQSIEIKPATTICLQYDHARTSLVLVEHSGGQVLPSGSSLYTSSTSPQGAYYSPSTTLYNCVRDLCGRHFIDSDGSVGAFLSAATGAFGQKLSIFVNGSTGYFKLTDSPDFDVFASTANDFYMGLWIYPTSAVGSTAHIAGQYEDGANSYHMYRSALGEFAFYAQTGSSTIVNCSGGTLAQNTWTHVAVVKVGSDLGLYVNGTQVGYAAQTLTDTFSGNMYLGQKGNSSSWFPGRMDDFAIVHSNIFGAAPVVGLTDTINIDTVNALNLVLTGRK